MRAGWVAVALVASGCIEGKDPNSCTGDSDCSGGRLCSQMETCELAENMFDLTAHWTLDGVTPTPASPGQCAGFDSFKLGAGDGSNGFAEEVTCADGVAQLPRVPATLFKVEAWAYRLESPTTGSFSVIGSASIDRADASEVTLAFVLP